MYVWTHKQNQMLIRPGFGQATSATVSSVDALAAAITGKFGIQLNSSQGLACVMSHMTDQFYRPTDPVKVDKALAAARECAAIRPWTLDELRIVERACELYCRLGLLPSKTMKINISRLGSWPIKNAGSPTWITCRVGVRGQTKCGPCTGTDHTCSTGTAETMIFDSAMSSTRSTKQKTETVAHELAHSLLVGRFWQQFSAWPRHPELTGGRPLSDFKGPDDGLWKEEDIADSVAFYLTDPGKLRKISKDRLEFLKKELRLSNKCR